MLSMIAAPPSLKVLILDDHATTLTGTAKALRTAYPEAIFQTVTTAQAAQSILLDEPLDLLVMDLSLPEEAGQPPSAEVGLALLRHVFSTQPELNIVVQSAKTEVLVRIKPLIDQHLGGFTIVDKSAALQDLLTKVDWALKEVVYTPHELRNGLEMRPEWIELLHLACEQALTDKAIAERMHRSERAIRHYWRKVQDALSVYPEAGFNIRMQTAIKARQMGLID